MLSLTHKAEKKRCHFTRSWALGRSLQHVSQNLVQRYWMKQQCLPWAPSSQPFLQSTLATAFKVENWHSEDGFDRCPSSPAGCEGMWQALSSHQYVAISCMVATFNWLTLIMHERHLFRMPVKPFLYGSGALACIHTKQQGREHIVTPRIFEKKK